MIAKVLVSAPIFISNEEDSSLVGEKRKLMNDEYTLGGAFLTLICR
jgi:hypothetical protein